MERRDGRKNETGQKWNLFIQWEQMGDSNCEGKHIHIVVVLDTQKFYKDGIKIYKAHLSVRFWRQKKQRL